MQAAHEQDPRPGDLRERVREGAGERPAVDAGRDDVDPGPVDAGPGQEPGRPVAQDDDGVGQPNPALLDPPSQSGQHCRPGVDDLQGVTKAAVQRDHQREPPR